MVIRLAGIFALALALFGAAEAQALTLEKIGDFDQPTYAAGDPSNASRLYVVERKGAVKAVEGGSVTTFADLSASVGCPAGCPNNRGLMSVALAPDFGASGRMYVAYASNVDGNVHIEEYVSTDTGHKSATFGRSLATIPYPPASLHFGGQLQVGRDGYLYISTGDGGGDGDPFHNAQSPTSPLGKILRLNPDAGTPYEVWSLGLRSPTHFSFDRQSGDMLVADVGEAREEVDLGRAPAANSVGGQGLNYGWNCREGGVAGPATDPECATASSSSFTAPAFEYTTSTQDPDLGGSRCAIVGGYVVRDPQLSAIAGRYIYTDYCSGVLRAVQLPESGPGQASDDCSLGLRADAPVSFGEDASSRLYLVEENGGVYLLTGPAGCVTPIVTTRKKATVPTFIGIKAQRRRVERGKRALLTVWVSPCKGRKGESVGLLRNGHRNGTRYLSRACTARFSPQIGRGTKFAAFTREEDEYLPGESRRLTVRIAHRQRPRR